MAIVVSPLMALVHDQVGALHETGVNAVFVNATLGFNQALDVELRLQGIHGMGAKTLKVYGADASFFVG